MAEEKSSWKRFQRLGFDSKKFSRRARRAETSTTRHAHKFVLSKLDSLRSVKQHIILWLVIVGVLIAAVALQMLWYQKAYRAEAWSSGGTYAEAVLGPVNTLNPLYATTNAELSASKLIFSSLLRYDRSGHLSNDLAQNMTVSNKGRTYTVTLRDDAHWSDGKKVTAQDVTYTVGLMKSPEVRSIMAGTWADIQAEAPDDHTVVFTLPGSYAAFPHALTFSVLPKHVLDKVAAGELRQNTFSVAPIGSGPFSVRLLQIAPDADHKIVYLTANKDYYKGAPKLARFELHAYGQQEDMARAVRTGEVNAAVDAGITNDALPKGFKATQFPLKSGVYALLNTESSYMKNVKVRLALQVGTDTTALRKSLPYPVPALHLPFTNGQLTGTKIPPSPAYNPAKAKQLLTKAGWKIKKNQSIRVNKKNQPLELRVVTVKDTIYEKVIEQLAGQWRKLGIDVKTEVSDPTSATQDFVKTTLQPRDYDVLLYELVIGVDPDVYAYWHSSQASPQGYNFSNYKSDVSDDALSSARARSEKDLRNEKYKVFARQWIKDAPAIGLYQSVMRYVYRTSVHPLIPQNGIPSSADRYSDILYWSALQTPVYKTP